MRYYRVTIVFDNGDGLTYDTYAENALCAVLLAGREAEHKPIDVHVEQLGTY